LLIVVAQNVKLYCGRYVSDTFLLPFSKHLHYYFMIQVTAR